MTSKMKELKKAGKPLPKSIDEVEQQLGEIIQLCMHFVVKQMLLMQAFLYYNNCR